MKSLTGKTGSVRGWALLLALPNVETSRRRKRRRNVANVENAPAKTP